MGNRNAPHVPAPLVNDLRGLASGRSGRLAIVSGRSVADLRARVGVADVFYAGCHGLTIVGPETTFVHPEAEVRRARLLDVANDLRRAAIDGLDVETKDCAVAVHYRHVTARDLPQIDALLRVLLAPHASELTVLPGWRAVEIVPATGWSKTMCVMWLRGRIAANGAAVVYLGDDYTDEPVFRALGRTAITVKVGPRADGTAAAFTVPDVDAAHALLARLAQTRA